MCPLNQVRIALCLFVSIQLPVDLTKKMFDRKVTKILVAHELSENLFVSLHAINQQPFKGFFKDVAEILFSVGYCRLFK